MDSRGRRASAVDIGLVNRPVRRDLKVRFAAVQLAGSAKSDDDFDADPGRSRDGLAGRDACRYDL
jgi:hypothetical protein